MTPEPDALTQPFPVYAAARRNVIIQQYRTDASIVSLMYPDHALLPEWCRAVERAADSGQRLPDAVLDSYRAENGDVSFALAFRGVATQEGWPGYTTLNEQAQRNLYGALRRTEGRQQP